MEADSSPPHPRPLRLLSMDGGGIRAISILVIIQEIMHRLQKAEKLTTVPLPADYFDLICGTDTGGIVALLLGRLRLSSDEAVSTYCTLAKKVFSEKKMKGKDGKFKASNLEKVIKDILVQKLGSGHDDDTMWEEGGCKTFVCALPAVHIEHPRLFRTWSADRNPGYNCKIWEAARATTAAPTFFKRIYIGESGLDEVFIGGGLGCNNPVQYLIKEAIQEFGADRQVGCIVSIGTGLRESTRLRAPGLVQRILPFELFNVLASIATNTQKMAEDMQFRCQDYDGLYHRLDVERGLESVLFDDWKSLGNVKTHTITYLEESAVSSNIDQIVCALSCKAPHEFHLRVLNDNISDKTSAMNSRPHQISTVPFEGNREFVGRTDVSNRLDSIFRSH